MCAPIENFSAIDRNFAISAEILQFLQAGHTAYIGLGFGIVEVPWFCRYPARTHSVLFGMHQNNTLLANYADIKRTYSFKITFFLPLVNV